MNWFNPRPKWEVAAGIFAAVWAIHSLYIYWFLGPNHPLFVSAAQTYSYRTDT